MRGSMSQANTITSSEQTPDDDICVNSSFNTRPSPHAGSMYSTLFLWDWSFLLALAAQWTIYCEFTSQVKNCCSSRARLCPSRRLTLFRRRVAWASSSMKSVRTASSLSTCCNHLFTSLKPFVIERTHPSPSSNHAFSNNFFTMTPGNLLTVWTTVDISAVPASTRSGDVVSIFRVWAISNRLIARKSWYDRWTVTEYFG